MEKCTVVVLAGGVGKRFVPLKTNKTLIPFLGKPILLHTLDAVVGAGFGNVVIVTNSYNNRTVAVWKKKRNCTVVRVLQKKAGGMANALLLAQKKLEQKPLLIINAVDIVDPSLFTKLKKTISENPRTGIIVGKKQREYFPGGYLVLENQRVVGVVEKPNPNETPSEFFKLVFDYIPKPSMLFEAMKPFDATEDDAYEQALSRLMLKFRFRFLSYTGDWAKLKYSFHILDVARLLLSKLNHYINKSARVAKSAVIKGSSFIDNGASIADGAVVVDSYIGKNVVVGNGALIRSSIVEKNSIVGFGAEIARSYIGPNTMIHHAFVGDSALEGWTNISYGTCFANWRMDSKKVFFKTEKEKIETGKLKLGAVVGKNVFFGAQSTTLPGVSIGVNTHIYPHSIVHKPLPSNIVLKMYQKQQIVKKD